MIKISKRLTMAASLICDGNVLADVGTDHGYVPIYLVEQGKIRRAIAMDINIGPLERAKAHIAQYGMEQYIETRLSDGVEALAVGEADAILIAGMGGGLVMHILSEGREICQNAAELVLQPQSELGRVRRFLSEEGYVTDAEEMVEEDGKYYPMMRVHYEPGAAEPGQTPVQNDTGHMPESNVISQKLESNGTNHMPENNGTSQKLENSGIIEADCRRENHRTAEADQKRQEVFFLYGRQLLEERHPVLREFLQKEQRLYQNILEGLKRQPQTELIIARRQAIKAALKQNKEALHFFK